MLACWLRVDALLLQVQSVRFGRRFFLGADVGIGDEFDAAFLLFPCLSILSTALMVAAAAMFYAAFTERVHTDMWRDKTWAPPPPLSPSPPFTTTATTAPSLVQCGF